MPSTRAASRASRYFTKPSATSELVRIVEAATAAQRAADRRHLRALHAREDGLAGPRRQAGVRLVRQGRITHQRLPAREDARNAGELAGRSRRKPRDLLELL